MHPFIRDYLTYSKRERRGIWVLLFILCALILAPSFFPAIDLLQEDYSQFEKEIAEFEAAIKEQEARKPKFKPKARYARKKIKKYPPSKPRKPYWEPQAIDINLADSADWVQLPGIGEGFTRRIMRFREVLGGFVNVDQLREVYGLDSARFHKIEPYLILEDSLIQVININSAGFDEMRKHPYLRAAIARWIVNYRKQHGPFQTVADLETSYVIKTEELKRLTPYIKVQ